MHFTRMVGQRFRTESLAKDVGSDVMDWAEALLADVGEDGMRHWGSGKLTGLGVVLHLCCDSMNEITEE